MNYELYLCLHRRSTLLLQKCTILSFLFVVVNCYSTFPTKTCALCWSLETSAIDVRLLHDTLNGHSPWLITFFQQSELFYWGFRPSNISCNGCSYVKRQVIYSFVAASSWVIMTLWRHSQAAMWATVCDIFWSGNSCIFNADRVSFH